MAKLPSASAVVAGAGHPGSGWSSWIGAHIGAYGVAALIVATVVLVFVASSLALSRPNRNLAAELEAYELHPRPEEREAAGPEGVVTVPVLRRLGDLLANVAQRRGVLEAIESLIQRAGLAISAGELLVVAVLGGVLLAVIGGLLAGFVGALVALVIAALAPPAALRFLADRRTRAFDAQLPDVLKLLSASLRAGFSLLQGLDALISHVDEPMAAEMRQAFAATRVGMPVEDAMQAVAERVASRDFEWLVMAIRIQREVGGNLAEILDTVATTMTARVQLRREVRTLTAEGRISAIILIALPVGIGLMVWVINRTYIDTLFNTFAGNVALIGALALEVFGGWWLYRTVQIEI